MHVLGPFARYPLAAERAYNVPEGTLEAHERMKRRVGLDGQQVRSEAVLPYRSLDAGELLEVLFEAVPDAATRRAILVDNAAKLYGFDR